MLNLSVFSCPAEFRDAQSTAEFMLICLKYDGPLTADILNINEHTTTPSMRTSSTTARSHTIDDRTYTMRIGGVSIFIPIVNGLVDGICRDDLGNHIVFSKGVKCTKPPLSAVDIYLTAVKPFVYMHGEPLIRYSPSKSTNKVAVTANMHHTVFDNSSGPVMVIADTLHSMGGYLIYNSPTTVMRERGVVERIIIAISPLQHRVLVMQDIDFGPILHIDDAVVSDTPIMDNRQYIAPVMHVLERLGLTLRDGKICQLKNIRAYKDTSNVALEDYPADKYIRRTTPARPSIYAIDDVELSCWCCEMQAHTMRFDTCFGDLQTYKNTADDGTHCECCEYRSQTGIGSCIKHLDS